MINIGGGGCGCSSLGRLGALSAVSASEACNQPGAWVNVKGSDGKCYSLCIFTGEKYEIDAASCGDAIAVPADWRPGQPIAATSSSLIPGVSNTVLMIGGGVLLLVLLMAGRR